MSSAQIITLAILSFSALLFLSNRIRAEIIALFAVILLSLTGIISSDEVFSGFGRSAVITIIALFILTGTLERTGASRRLGSILLKLTGQSTTRTTLVVMLVSASLSLFMNNIAAAAVLLPIVKSVSTQTRINLSRLLIPLGFGTILGGMATLFTTSNILVSTALRDQGLQGFGVLSFAPVGGIVALVGILFVGLIAWRWLPDHPARTQVTRLTLLQHQLSDLYQLKERLWELKVTPESPLILKSLSDSQIGGLLGLSVMAVVRDQKVYLSPRPGFVFYPDDTVLVAGREDRVDKLAGLGLQLLSKEVWHGSLSSSEIEMFEIVVAPRSTAAGKTLKELHFREKYDLSALAIWRQGRSYRTDVGEMALQFGDALLIYGHRNKVHLLQTDQDYIVMGANGEALPEDNKATLATLITVGSVVVAALGLIPVAESLLAGALIAVLAGCIRMDDAYRAVEWRVVFLVAAMLPLGLAMNKSGTAAYLSHALVDRIGTYGQLAALASFFLLTVVLTQIMTSQTTAIVVSPIALTAAHTLGANPYAFAMAVAIGSSTAFLTPVSHPVNILMMAAGDYKLKDYLKVGLPLSILVFITVLLVLPLIFPLH